MKRLFAELVLLTAGAVCVSKAGWDAYRYWQFQNQRLPRRIPAQTFLSPSLGKDTSPGQAVLGQLSIPRLHLSAVVVEGDDEESLRLAVGHMKETAPLGSNGNAVVAGHRDTVFWPLRNIKAGDAIVVSTDKKYFYAVERTQIVDPENTSSLQNSQRPTLTVITCYPFRHVGPAPKRFIVTARLLRAQS